MLDEYLRNISHFLDKEYQKRVWIFRNGPECQAFDDAVCDFFDIGRPILENREEFGITNEQFYLLKKLRDEFEFFSDKNECPKLFIDTPEWGKIMNLAQEVLTAFNYKSLS